MMIREPRVVWTEHVSEELFVSQRSTDPPTLPLIPSADPFQFCHLVNQSAASPSGLRFSTTNARYPTAVPHSRPNLCRDPYRILAPRRRGKW